MSATPQLLRHQAGSQVPPLISQRAVRLLDRLSEMFPAYGWQVGLFVLLVGFWVSVLSQTVADPDLWGHLRFGLDILRDGEIARVDPYSYLSGPQPWINHEWLAEVLFALSWKWAGVTGLVGLKVAVNLLVICLVYRQIARTDLGLTRAGILVSLAMIALLRSTLTVRPHMFTSLLFVLTLLVVIRAESSGLRWLWAAPIIFALWVNLHGGVLAGVAVLLAWAVIHLSVHRRDYSTILPPVAATLLATLLNPYGINLLSFLVRTATIPRPDVTEWQPLALVSPLGVVYGLLLGISGLGLLYSRLERNRALIFLYGLLIWMPFVAIRHIELATFGILLLTADHIGDAWSRLRSPRSTNIFQPGKWALLPVTGGLALLVWAAPNFSKIPIWEPLPQPVNAISLLQQTGVSGSLFVYRPWGEYAIWHLGPTVQVSIDGRRETVYSEEIHDLYLSFDAGEGDWDAILAVHRPDFILVRNQSVAKNLLILDGGWDLIFQDPISALFIPSGSSYKRALMMVVQSGLDLENAELFP